MNQSHYPPLPPGILKHPPVQLRLPPLPPGLLKHPPLPGPAHLHAAATGGVPGWEITLAVIAIALLLAAVVLIGRALAARQHATARAA